MTKYKISKNGVGIIPKGEEIIEAYAFKMCKKLTSIVIPEGVSRIGWRAFYGCINLKEIYLPNSMKFIDLTAFQGCKNLTSIVIPEGIERLYPYLFPDCDNLSSIVVAEGNKKFDSRNNCNAIIETESNKLLYGCANTIIPEGVTEISTGAFYRLKNLTSISIPNSVKSIGEGAFFGCANLNNITIPESVEFIGPEAFRNCSNLTTITIPDGVKIADNAFEYSPCSNIKNKSKKSSKEKEQTVTFSYAGQLIYSIKGECTLELTVEELKLFKQINQQAKDAAVYNILEYFKEEMPQSLFDKIDIAIYQQIRYQDALEAIECEDLDCFQDMSLEEFESMTKEELIERFIDDNSDGLYEYNIESIEIKE